MQKPRTLYKITIECQKEKTSYYKVINNDELVSTFNELNSLVDQGIYKSVSSIVITKQDLDNIPCTDLLSNISVTDGIALMNGIKEMFNL